jgi:AcrR family transcriptional regulator
VPEESSLDPRIRRTRRSLQEAMLALAAECDFASISVRDITDRAEVNRATFYLHYCDKEDLTARALDALFEEVTAESRAFADEHGRLSPEIVPPPFLPFLQHLESRRALYRRLLGGIGASAFAERLRLFEQGEFLRIWTEMGLTAAPDSPPVALRARTATGIVQAVISWWLDQDEPDTPETVAAWMWHLLIPLWFDNRDAVLPTP